MMDGAIFGKYNGASEPAPEDIVDRKYGSKKVVLEMDGKTYVLHEGDTFHATIKIVVDSKPGSGSFIDLSGAATTNIKVVSIK
jgi:hypothetical protein